MVLEHVRAIVAYRGFVLASVRREFQLTYQNSLLGAAWMVLNPLAMILIYTVIFSQVMRARLPGVDNAFGYSIYICTGVLLWGLFAEVSMRARSIFLEHANTLKKINFPRLCLPLIVVSSGLVNFVIVFGLFLLFLVVVSAWPGWVMLALVPVIALVAWFAIALGVVLGILNVFFRDVGQAFGVILQFWFWLTPIVYPIDVLPPVATDLLRFNPMASCINAAQDVVFRQVMPDWVSMLPTLVLTLLLSIWAVRLYLQHGAEMVDEL